MSRQGSWPPGFFKWITIHGHGALLEGSIFQWANEHRPLVHGDERVSRVHPYNSFWGRLLEPDVRGTAPE